MRRDYPRRCRELLYKFKVFEVKLNFSDLIIYNFLAKTPLIARNFLNRVKIFNIRSERTLTVLIVYIILRIICRWNKSKTTDRFKGSFSVWLCLPLLFILEMIDEKFDRSLTA